MSYYLTNLSEKLPRRLCCLSFVLPPQTSIACIAWQGLGDEIVFASRSCLLFIRPRLMGVTVQNFSVSADCLDLAELSLASIFFHLLDVVVFAFQLSRKRVEERSFCSSNREKNDFSEGTHLEFPHRRGRLRALSLARRLKLGSNSSDRPTDSFPFFSKSFFAPRGQKQRHSTCFFLHFPQSSETPAVIG